MQKVRIASFRSDAGSAIYWGSGGEFVGKSSGHTPCTCHGMHGAKSYDEREIYKLAAEIRRLVIEFTGAERVSRDFKFVQQIRDAARGAPRNIAEGFSRCAPGEFHQFLSYAKASLDETRNHVVDAFESGYLSESQRDELLTLIRRTIAGIRGLMRYLKSPAAKRAYDTLRARESKTPDHEEP